MIIFPLETIALSNRLKFSLVFAAHSVVCAFTVCVPRGKAVPFPKKKLERPNRGCSS